MSTVPVFAALHNFVIELKTEREMNIITIESSAFKELVRQIREISAHIRKSGRREEEEKANADELLTSKEACRLMRVSGRTLQRMRDSRVIPFTYVGNSCRYRHADIERYMEERHTEAERVRNYVPRIMGKEATDGSV